MTHLAAGVPFFLPIWNALVAPDRLKLPGGMALNQTVQGFELNGARGNPVVNPMDAAINASVLMDRIVPVNATPSNFDPGAELPEGFLQFLLALHRALGPLQGSLIARRSSRLTAAGRGKLPDYLPASPATSESWRIELPEWCRDQRNQMTGPADEAELVVKMLNSGAPGVMLDLEDSLANNWTNLQRGIENIVAALHGELTYVDRKRNRTVSVSPSTTVIFTRPRGLHMHQAGVIAGELIPASIFDVALVAWKVDAARLKHPLCFYIPKSESAEEAVWWNALFNAIEKVRGWEHGWIKCMALVESHPLAFEMEEFAWNLRDHIMGLNLGRWDYMASLIHFNLHDPNWVLPDRNTIPHDVPFFQNLRMRMPEVCHKHGMLAIGGMTALFPSREDADLNARALAILAADKKNEANCKMDGAWTGHPDQNEIAVAQFPFPNQLSSCDSDSTNRADLRPVPRGIGKRTLAGTRAAIRTVIRFRAGVLAGRGASLLDGYMEDLATDRIYRLMIAQRMRHYTKAAIVDEHGLTVVHTPDFVSQLFDQELVHLLAELPSGSDPIIAARFREARRISEEIILCGEFTPA
jgi:malate synthase